MKMTILALGLVLISSTSNAAKLAYSADFLNSELLQSHSGALYFEDSTVATNIPAFDGDLGILSEVQVNWSFGLNYSGLGDEGGGSLSYGMGGGVYINGTYTNGGGFGGGSGIDPSTMFMGSTSSSVNVDLTPLSSLWNTVSGDSLFTVSFGPSTNSYFTYSGVGSGNVSTFRDVSVSFIYTPVPEPRMYLLFLASVPSEYSLLAIE